MNSKINKLIAWGGIVAIVLVAVVIALVNIAAGGTLNDDYFVSDSRKLVYSTIQEMPEELPTTYAPIVTHYVYYYHDQDVTGAKIFLQFNSAEEATTVNNELTMEGDGEITNKYVNGKYLVMDTNPEAFTTMTTASLRSQIDEAKTSDTYAELVNGTWTLVNQTDDSAEADK